MFETLALTTDVTSFKTLNNLKHKKWYYSDTSKFFNDELYNVFEIVILTTCDVVMKMLQSTPKMEKNVVSNKYFFYKVKIAGISIPHLKDVLKL